MLSIGLTGGIASGKTLVSNRFAELGAPVIDADLLSREVVQPGTSALESLRVRFGDAIITESGELNRSRLRDIIFSSDADRHEVEAILHPAIRSLSAARAASAELAGHLYVIHAIPLLVETGQQTRFDRVVVVDVPVELQLERLMMRDGLERELAEQILGTQASRAERLAVADDVIINSGAPAEALARVDALDEQYRAMAASPGP